MHALLSFRSMAPRFSLTKKHAFRQQPLLTPPVSIMPHASTFHKDQASHTTGQTCFLQVGIHDYAYVLPSSSHMPCGFHTMTWVMSILAAIVMCILSEKNDDDQDGGGGKGAYVAVL